MIPAHIEIREKVVKIHKRLNELYEYWSEGELDADQTLATLEIILASLNDLFGDEGVAVKRRKYKPF